MKIKEQFKLLICCLLICALLPLNNTFASVSIDRDGDGIHIDDIVYYQSQTGSLSNQEILDLLDHIAPVNPSQTAAGIASGITNVSAPAADGTWLTLPTVPLGYSIGISYTSNSAVIGTNSVIVPPTESSVVNLVFTVTRVFDNSTAETGLIAVTVPAHILSAAEVATGITSLTVPVTNAVYMPLPNVPTGYTIVISSSSEEQVVSTSGAIVPPVIATPVNLVFTVTRISDNSTADTISFTVTIPARSSITLGGTVTASGALTGGEGMDMAFDGTTSTKWYSGSIMCWIQYQLSAPHIVTTYSVASANDSPGRDPANWTLKGSNDETTWTTLDTRAGEYFASRYQTNTYTITNSTSYLYYRLDVTGNSGDSVTQLSEIVLYGTPAPVTPTGVN